MHFSNPILFLICSIGVFNGFLVSLYFMFFSKQKRTQNLLFGLLVFFLSVRIGKSVYVIFTEREERNFWLIQIGLSACSLIGISLYYYLKSSIQNIKETPNSWKLHFSILAAFIIVLGALYPYKHNYFLWNHYFGYFIYVVWGAYLLASLVLVKDIIQKFIIHKNASTAEIWLLAVYVANLLIFIAYIVGMFYLYLVGTITFSVVFYVLFFFFLSKNNREIIFQDIPEKYAAKKIQNNEAKVLISRLDVLMKEEELFKNTNIKLLNVAKKLQITPHKLSQLLNDNLGKSFASFLNDYRIEESKKLLQQNQKLTLEAIGFESGFSSKSNFYAVFKKVVGQTPAQYQKQFS